MADTCKLRRGYSLNRVFSWDTIEGGGDKFERRRYQRCSLFLIELRQYPEKVVDVVAEQADYRFVSREDSHIVLIGVDQQSREEWAGDKESKIGEIAG